MTRTVSLYDAKTKLSALVEDAAAGEEIIIAKSGKPRARLVPLERQSRARRRPGLFAGRIRIADDFDAPWPEDIRRALEGENPIEPNDAPSPG
ncbi:MAG: type II toxin-antitoxin system Phd/YefM family antitoxin [Geminicoccaceae bacterium]